MEKICAGRCSLQDYSLTRELISENGNLRKQFSSETDACVLK